MNKEIKTVKRVYGESIYTDHYSNGKLIKTENPVYTADYIYEGDNLDRVEYSNGNVDRFEYDSLGRNIKDVYSDGSICEYEYEEILDEESNTKKLLTKMINTTSENYTWEWNVEEVFDHKGRIISYKDDDDKEEYYSYND